MRNYPYRNVASGVILLLISLFATTTAATADSATSAWRYSYGDDSNQRLSMTKGVILTFIPGLVVHGSGSIYAKSPDLGAGLIVAEAAGALMIFLGVHSKPDENVYPYESSSPESDALIIGGIVLFAGSWLTDLIMTPILIDKHNDRLDHGTGVSLDIRKSHFEKDCLILGITYQF